MKNLTFNEFLRYRGKTYKGIIKVESTNTTHIPMGTTLQTTTCVETFIAENNKRYEMHIIDVEGMPGVLFRGTHQYKLKNLN